MKNLLYSAILAILLAACTSNPTDKEKTESSCSSSCSSASCCPGKSTASLALINDLSVDQVLATPENYMEKKIDLTGLVVHTCKKSGKKLFLKGENDSIFIRVEAGENISQFTTSLEGELVTVTGVFNVFTQETSDHHEECESEEKSKSYTLLCESYKQL